MDESEKNRINRLIKRELLKPTKRKWTKKEIFLNIFIIFNGAVFLLSSTVNLMQLMSNKSKQSNAISETASESQTIQNYPAITLKAQGDEALQQNNEQSAICFYKQSVASNPNDTETLISLINLMIKNEQYDDSLQYLEKLKSMEPNNVTAYRVEGSVLSLIGKYDESVESLTKAVEIDPTDANSYKLMGDMSLKQAQYENAVKYYEKALSIEDKDAAVYQNMGVAYAQVGRYDDALKCYDEALQIDPANETVLNNKQVIIDNFY